MAPTYIGIVPLGLAPKKYAEGNNALGVANIVRTLEVLD